MNQQDQVKVAVIGLGLMGTTHLRAYLNNPKANVVAVCGRSRLPVDGVLKGVAGNVTQSEDMDLGKAVRVFKDPRQLFADEEIQLVDICTPTARHPEQVIGALRAGKHVLCEKPLAGSADEARRVIDVAENSPGMLMTGMCMRFWPGWSWLKETLSQERYGKVLAARFLRASEMPAWSSGYEGNDTGGALFDLHIHDTDFVTHVFGRPTGVFSSGVTDANGAVSHVVTHYRYPRGPAVTAEGGWLRAAGFDMAYTVYCERATLDFAFARGPEALHVIEPGSEPAVVSFDETDGYGPEIDHFLDCVRRRKPSETMPAADAVTALEICEAEEKSIRTGHFVALS